MVRRRLERGWLHLLYTDVYLVGVSEPPPLALELGAVLSCGEGSLLSHRPAAQVWRFVAAVPGVMHVTVCGRRPRPRTGIVIHHGAISHDATRFRDIPITSPLQTLIDFASGADEEELERAMATAQQMRLLRREHLDELRARSYGKRGAAALGSIIDAAVPKARSRGEARLARSACAAGLTKPLVNESVFGHELDLYWPEHGLNVEVDDYATHSDLLAFERDRRRDLDLKGHGIDVMRVTTEQVRDELEATVALIAAALATRAGTPRAATTARARAR